MGAVTSCCIPRKAESDVDNYGKTSARTNQDLSLAQKSTKGNSSSDIKININTSDVFQLMKVNGLGQVLAENITRYRDDEGPFKSVDDLVKVKGIGPNVLGTIRHQLTLEDTSDRTVSVHITEDAPKSAQNLQNITGPSMEKSDRPKVTPFSYKYKNRNVVRIASWNVERFSDQKADNPGVREVICMTILENGFSLIAFQELAEDNALDKICEELNNPSLPNVKQWQGHRGEWKVSVSKAAGWMYQSMEYNGFLYDSSKDINTRRKPIFMHA